MIRLDPPLIALASLLAWGCGGATPTASRPSSTATLPAVEAPPERQALHDTRLISQPSESAVIGVRVAFESGSADDPRGKEGLTYLTAQLMAQAAAGDRSYAQIAELLFPMAAELEVEVDREHTVFVARVHRDHLEVFYGVLSDILTRPAFRQDDFDRLRAQQRSALTLDLRGSDDEALGKSLLQAMIYEGSSLAHPTLGTEEGIDALSVEDVRAHYGRVFCAGRATVGVVGAYPDGFGARVRALVAGLGTSTCEGRLPVHEVEPRPAPRVWIVDKAEAESVAMSLGFGIEVDRAHPDYPALTLAAAYFGQHRQFAGLLMRKMRGDRGLNYGDYAYAEHFEQEGWTAFPRPNVARRAQYFSMWIRPVPLERAHFALRMAIRELNLFVERGLSSADFERIRTYVDRYYALFLQTESRRLGFAIDDAYYGRERAWLDHLREVWRGLTADQVNAALRRHLRPSALEIAIVGRDGAAFADRLASDTPSPITYTSPPAEAVLAEDREIESYRVGIARESIRVIPLAEVFRAGVGADSPR